MEPLFGVDQDNEIEAGRKGALVVDLLRQEMGEATFFAVLRHFATQFRGGHATFCDFATVCNEVSGRDWLPFLMHWCFGRGYPSYQLVKFQSTNCIEGWQASVVIRNDGQGFLTCPLELRTTSGPQREQFAVPQGECRAFTWQTAGRVTNVIIDPDHTAMQGDDAEARRKMLAIDNTEGITENWLLYWKGVMHGEIGDYAKAEELLSRAIARSQGVLAEHSYFYSRGVVRLQAGQVPQATEDLRRFLDGILQPGRDKPDSLNTVLEQLSFAGLLRGATLEQRRDEMHEILRLLTGTNQPKDTGLAAWRGWWVTHGAEFRPSADARKLTPGGMRLKQLSSLPRPSPPARSRRRKAESNSAGLSTKNNPHRQNLTPRSRL
jgi:hypothetical protein